MGKAARRKAVAAENTIFDSVYRTMIQKMPQLVLAVINEVFYHIE